MFRKNQRKRGTHASLHFENNVCYIDAKYIMCDLHVICTLKAMYLAAIQQFHMGYIALLQIADNAKVHVDVDYRLIWVTNFTKRDVVR